MAREAAKGNVQRESRVLALVQGALEQEEHTRDQWIARECGDDKALSLRVVTLVKDALNTKQLLETGGALRSGGGTDPNRIGDFEIEETIGEGGMAVVYLGTRAVGSQAQRVAIKVNRIFGNTDAAKRRFESERELLASLNHPYVAHLLDWGATEDGDVYQVMEWIDGVPIDEFVKERHYSVAEIVQLLLQVCMAVAASHQNLIIHRDLKPSNILVTQDGIPKLIDFGIAKQVDSELTSREEIAFTLAFASPEQIRGEMLTTATDVYSLGVLAYLLLTGQRPHDIAGLSWHQAQELISQTPIRAPENLSNDLSLILETALQSDINRRYGTVQELVADLENYLQDRPISVKAESATYRFMKFVRRNAALTTSIALVTLSLTVALGVSLWQTQRAEIQLTRAEVVTQFLRDLIIANSPGAGGSYQLASDVTLLEILGVAEAQLLEDDTVPWDLRADLLSSIAHSLMWMEQPDRAISTQQASLGLVRDHMSSSQRDHNLFIRSLALTGETYENVGDFERAIRYYAQADEMATAEGVNLDDRWLYVLNNYGFTLMEANRWSEAEDVLQRALALSDQVWELEHSGRATLNLNLASVELESGRLSEASERLLSVGFTKELVDTPYLIHKWWRTRARTLEASGLLLEAAGAFSQAGRVENLVYSYADVEQTLDKVNAVRLELMMDEGVSDGLDRLKAITAPYREVLHLDEAWPVDHALSVAYAKLNQEVQSREYAQVAMTKAQALASPKSDLDRIALWLE